ncbi:Mo-co oxidoreductase dimerization domain-containing protein, partial [Terfezia claveryi]
HAINSVICTPETGDEIQADAEGKIVVAGYALPAGDDGPVTKVEISLDRGETWEETDIVQETPTRWSWALWGTKVDVRRLMPTEGGESSKRIWCRAQDKGGNTQDGKCQWNYRGVGYNGYGEVKDLTIKGIENQPVEKALVSGMTNLAIGAAA